MKLGQDQRTALTVLAFLFLRMGLFEKARRTYAVLAALHAEDPPAPTVPTVPSASPAPLDELDRLALAGLAAAELETNAPESALEHVMLALEDHTLSTRQLPLLLLKARALWRCNRRTEARAALETWGRQSGGHALAEALGTIPFSADDPVHDETPRNGNSHA